MEDKVDLLIVGAGPAGLMAAAWAAVLGIKTRIIDKRATKIMNGHADGLQSRTLEIFDSFGFGRRVYEEANRMQEVCLWNPDGEGRIRRTDRITDTVPGISRYQQSVLHQGRIEQYFLDFISEKSNIAVEHLKRPLRLEIDESSIEDGDAYPMTVKIQTVEPSRSENRANVLNGTDHVSTRNGFPNIAKGEDSALEHIQCKYLIGCDGAHSWVRGQLGFVMEGEQTESVWGVMDIVPITNFPDIRMRCTIHSSENGTIMVIPRERDLVRLYIQLAHIRPGKGERFDRSDSSPDLIFRAAKKILEPYEISYKYCEWWTIYQVGQRVANHFNYHDRVFLAGDAVHTHSPKAGQGMNVSMHDTYNLVWKIGSVIEGTAKRAILSTYESERRNVALELIEFDRLFSRMFAGKPAKDAADEAGVSMTEFKSAFEKGNIFTSGMSVSYGPNLLVAKPPPMRKFNSISELILPLWIGGIGLGMRFPSFQVVQQADAKPIQFAERLRSDGRWRVTIFAGDISQRSCFKRLQELGNALALPDSILQLYNSNTQKFDSLIEFLVIHAAPRKNVELFEIHEVFRPFDSETGWDYYKVFADDHTYHNGHGQAYKWYGVDEIQGAAVIIRPDQYCGWKGEVNDLVGMAEYFRGILIAKDAP